VKFTPLVTLAGRRDWAAEKRTALDAHRLPAIYHVKEYANEGGLLAYAPPLVDSWRSAASYVDRILRGAKPADLPVQFPTRFALVVNLRTAKAMGLTIPESFLNRADEVIE
jgi:putative tryptophan/tyrosine transport system substrate-binding protein